MLVIVVVHISLVDSDVDLDELLKRSYQDGEKVTVVIENVSKTPLFDSQSAFSKLVYIINFSRSEHYTFLSMKFF